MKKTLKWVSIVLVSLAIILFGTFKYLQSQTKKASPEGYVEYVKGDTHISIFYCRPYKKNRNIFGELVPYGKVWRTGANEATTFTTNKALTFGTQQLPAGKYTLWTIPNENQWTVIFNSKQYGWGVNFDREASRAAEADVLKIDVPVTITNEVIEQFTININEDSTTALVLTWDKVKVAVPFQ